MKKKSNFDINYINKSEMLQALKNNNTLNSFCKINSISDKKIFSDVLLEYLSFLIKKYADMSLYQR